MQDLIHTKLQGIFDKTKILKEENINLKAIIHELHAQTAAIKKIIDIQKNTIEKLEQQNNLTNIASKVNLLSDEEKKRLKSAISEQIKEINHCLTLLKKD